MAEKGDCIPGSLGLAREQVENSKNWQAPSRQAWNTREQGKEGSSKSLKAPPLLAESMMSGVQGASCTYLQAPGVCSLAYCKSVKGLVGST